MTINLDTPLGEYQTSGTIKKVIIDNVTLQDDRVEKKVNFVVELENGKEIKVNSAFVEKGGAKVQQGFWLSTDEKGGISRLSTIGRLMHKFKIDTLREFEDQKLDLFLGKNDILITDTSINN